MAQTPTLLDTILVNDRFWPDVPIRDWVEGYRIPLDGREQGVKPVLLAAMLDANDALKPAKAAAKAAGYATLADYSSAHPEEVLDGQPEVQILYFAAVFNLAKAKTLKRLQVQNRRPLQETETLATDNTEGYFLDESQNAVGRILERMAPAAEASTRFGIYVAEI